MSDLTPLSDSRFLKNISKENNNIYKVREIVRNYFFEKYNSKISIISFQNNFLSIKVSEASLAAEINYNKQTDIKNINTLINPEEVIKLTIKIG